MRQLMIALLGIGISLTVNAQYSPCVTVTATTFPMNPQIYMYNYFGITVSLDQAYDQNITVSGYIYPQDHPNTDNPFSITITAGNITYSTSDMFYQASAAIDSATAEITAITPSTVTLHSVSYSTQCVLTGYPTIPPVVNNNNSMEYYGSIHNQGLISIMPTVNFSTATVSWAEQASTSYLKSQQGIDTTGAASMWASGATSHIPDPSYNVFSDNPDSLIDVMYDSSLIDLSVKNYLYGMVHIMDSLVASTADPDVDVYNSLCTALINLETTISNDGGLSASDKQNLLGAASTTRYSASYWGNYISNGGTLGDRDILEGNLAYDGTWPRIGEDVAVGGPNVNTDDWSFGYGMHQSHYLFRIHWKGLFRADFTGFIAGFVKGIFAGSGALGAGAISGLASSVAYAIIGDN